jgi:hypothetical protein
MEELSPNERFNQLLSFLSDPQGNPHPTLAFDGSIFLPGRKCTTLMVNNLLKEAIEIMRSDMFHNGLLKGNQKTPDIEIRNIERFVLQIAAVIHITRKHLAKAFAEVRLNTCDGKISVYNELTTAWHDFWKAFNKVAKIMLGNGLILPDKLMGLDPSKREILNTQLMKLLDEGEYDEVDRIMEKERKKKGGIMGELFLMRAQSLYKANSNEAKIQNNLSFDPIVELIRLFLINVPQAPDPLIARHIFDFIIKIINSSLKGIYLPDLESTALRKKVTKQRKLTAKIAIQ